MPTLPTDLWGCALRAARPPPWQAGPLTRTWSFPPWHPVLNRKHDHSTTPSDLCQCGTADLQHSNLDQTGVLPRAFPEVHLPGCAISQPPQAPLRRLQPRPQRLPVPRPRPDAPLGPAHAAHAVDRDAPRVRHRPFRISAIVRRGRRQVAACGDARSAWKHTGSFPWLD